MTQLSHKRERVAASSTAFKPHERIRRRAEFQRVYEHGFRLRGRYSTLFTLPNTLSVAER